MSRKKVTSPIAYSSLLRVKGPRAPIDGLIGLVVIAFQDLFNERPVGNGFAVTERHRRDLGVEKRAGDDARLLIHDLDILAGGMKNLEHRLVRHESVKRRQVEAGKRIGDYSSPGAAIWIRHSFGL